MNIKLTSICVAVGAFVILNTIAIAEPMDRRAYDLLQIVKTIADRSDQQLTSTEVDAAVSACEVASVQTRMAAAYLLAFTDVPAGTNALSVLTTNSSPEVAGVAKFSVLRKQLVPLNDKELLSDMGVRFSKIQHPWTRTLAVSWLGDRLKDGAVPFFLAALENEKDGLPRAELFFQIATYGNLEELAKACSILKQTQGKPDGVFHESGATFLNMVSSSPSKRAPMPGVLKSMIESRMKKLQE